MTPTERAAKVAEISAAHKKMDRKIALKRALLTSLPLHRDRATLLAIVAEMKEEPREALAAWMIQNSIATGHGDSFTDLLAELAAEMSALREHNKIITETLRRRILRDQIS